MLKIFRLYIFSIFFFAIPAYGGGSFEYFLNFFHFQSTDSDAIVRTDSDEIVRTDSDEIVEEFSDEPIGGNERDWNRLEREIRRELSEISFPNILPRLLKEKRQTRIKIDKFFKKLSQFERKLTAFVESNVEVCTNLRMRELREDIGSKSKKKRKEFFKTLWDPYIQERRHQVLSQMNAFQSEFQELSKDFYFDLDNCMSKDDHDYTLELFEDIEKMISKCVAQYAQL